jgi:hypothetical protein
MKEETKFLKNQFEERSKIKALSAKSAVGSMRGYIFITVLEADVKQFIEQYYQEYGIKSVGMVPVKFLGSEYKGKRSLIINKSSLL